MRIRTDEDRRKERIRQQRARSLLRVEITKIKSEAGCSNCKEKDPVCLQFHHTDAESKLASINRAIASKMRKEMLFKEIAKCIILCANCHLKLHWIESH